MNDIKLNDEQIEQLQTMYGNGYRFLCRTNDKKVHAVKKMIKNSKYVCFNGNCAEEIDGINFPRLTIMKPFYFGDMFKVVYCGK